MNHSLVAYTDRAQFLAEARPFLSSDPCLHSSVWGNALRASEKDPFRAWTLQRKADSQVVGALVWRGPKRTLYLTDIPVDAGHALVEGLRPFTTEEFDPRQSRFAGPTSSINTLNEVRQQTRLEPLVVKMRLSLYRCERVTRDFPVGGSLRLATEDDRSLCSEWARLFGLHAGLTLPNHPAPSIDGYLDQKRLFLWDLNGIPMASAAWVRPTPLSAHVAFVFVPKEFRGRHYAGAVTAAVTRLILDHENKAFATLFTDAANPVTNHLYPSLGYELVDSFQEAALPA